MLLAVASDKGSPGVTTTALTLAAVWPRRTVLAELDPFGGDIALRLRGPRGAPLSPETGVLSLAARLGTATKPEQVFEHVQRLDGGLEVLLGLPTAEHAAALAPACSRLSALLATIPGVDVVADCGRLYPNTPMLDVMRHASCVVLVTRVSIDAVAHLRARAAALAHELRARVPGGVPIYVVPVTKVRDDRSAREIDLVLRQANVPASVIGRIAHDPQGAGMLTGEWLGRLDRSLLVRSAREVAAALAQATLAQVGG